MKAALAKSGTEGVGVADGVKVSVGVGVTEGVNVGVGDNRVGVGETFSVGVKVGAGVESESVYSITNLGR